MALSGHSLFSAVIDARTLKSDQGEHAPQIQVDFLEIRKFLKDPRGHKTVVGVVIYHLRAQASEHLVVSLRRRPLKPRVRFSVGSDSIHDLAAVQVAVHHLIHGVQVILSVAVDGDRYIAAVRSFHHAGNQRVLVSPVPALADPQEPGVLVRQAADYLPGAVLRSVIDKEDPAPGVYPPAPDEKLQFVKKHRRCDRQYLLLVIAWNYDP